ncbi:MAG: hypothetical protein KAR19_14475 [Bacteroidales bacterium]|nr:hypothetical protein [Bacteroidales bacterium]
MVDNKPLEEQAENYIKSQLIKFGFNVMKPSFDKKGSDLIIVDNIEKQNSRLIKVQSKGRTISDKTTNVKIPISYVENDFILFIYTIDDKKNESCFLFFAEDINLWKKNGNDFTISFNENKISTEYFKHKLLNQKLANQILKVLAKTEIKKYTSIIIDGIFLGKAIIKTIQTYQQIWPDKKFINPKLSSIVENILNKYDRHESEKKSIICYLLISDSFSLENIVDVDYSNQIFITKNGNQVRTFINRTDEIIAFEVIEQMERLVNNDNIILVADDIIYETELSKYKDSGIEMILVKLNENDGSDMFVHYMWGDIMYPIGIAIGLEKHEL